MANFTQTSGTAPAYQSDVLVGDGHIVVDRPFGASLTLTKFTLVSLDDTLNTWTAYDAADQACGILLEDVTTGVGESQIAAVAQSGAIKFSLITDGTSTVKVGENVQNLVMV